MRGLVMDAVEESPESTNYQAHYEYAEHNYAYL